MSTDKKIAIRVKNLGKKYTLGGPQENYLTLSDAIVNSVKAPFKRFHRAQPDEGFWALKNVSFDVEQGEVVGIIGRNGAGKSTLLKILSRITSPSEGTVELHGRVGSLLEVGTGFHPELTGRENIFLSGSILGMKHAEIEQKLDEIVKFSEIGKFLDTPVKRYSSGMYVRLAFAVAAHMDTEILVIDEVLAVGDAAFQKKCLGKMGEVAKHGRTVLFVSHNMNAVTNLCDKGILLQNGMITQVGNINNVISGYLDKSQKEESLDIEGLIKKLPTDPVFRLKRIDIKQNSKKIASQISNADPVTIEILFELYQRITGLRVYVDVCDNADLLLFRSFHDEQDEGIGVMEAGEYTSTVKIPENLLGPIKYEFRVQAGIYNVRDCIPQPGIRIPIYVEKLGKYNRAYMSDTFRGKLALSLKWNTERKKDGGVSNDIKLHY
jgi:lipopolysaccharide transport system ATP-binding protein